MNFKMPHFTAKEAESKEEKLIVQLERDLIDTTQVFLKLHKSNLNSQEIFTILRDGSLAYAGRKLLALARMLQDKQDVPRFVDEAREIFECYLQQIKEDK